MNLFHEVINEINMHPEWSKFVIARFIYLKTCMIYEYDYRYDYGGLILREELLKRNHNIENVQDFRIICTEWAEIYVNLLKKFNIHATVANDFGIHSFVNVEIDDYKIVADSTSKDDFARVKFGSCTYGYECEFDNAAFQKKLQEVDKTLGFLKETYMNQSIDMISKEIKKTSTPYSDKMFLNKFCLVMQLIHLVKNVKGFEDSHFSFHYLIRKFMTYYEQDRIETCICFKEREDDLEIFDVIMLEFDNNDKMYFSLKKEIEDYKFQEISYSDVEYFLENYSAMNRQRLLQNSI